VRIGWVAWDKILVLQYQVFLARMLIPKLGNCHARQRHLAVMFFRLEVTHDKIPNGYVTSHDFNDLFCNLG
jgi:hypothetical protein